MIPRRRPTATANQELVKRAQEMLPSIIQKSAQESAAKLVGRVTLMHIRTRQIKWLDAETIYELGTEGFEVGDLIAEWLKMYSELSATKLHRVKIPGVGSFLVLPHVVSAERVLLGEWAEKLRLLQLNLKSSTEEKK